MISGIEIGVSPKGTIVGDFRSPSGSPELDECVQVAPLDTGGRAVRDSKDPAGPVLYFTAGEWQRHLDAVRAGEFEL